MRRFPGPAAGIDAASDQKGETIELLVPAAAIVAAVSAIPAAAAPSTSAWDKEWLKMPSMIWELKVVNSLSGRTFDYWYSNLEVYDHSQDISEAKSEAGDGTNPRVRQEAPKELPTLRVHLGLAHRALNASKA